MEADNTPSEAELLVKEAKENQTRKILAIVEECADQEEIKKRIKQLLEE